MTTKNFRDLTYSDVGKQVELIESNGDKSSGILTMVRFGIGPAVRIGNTVHSELDPEQEFIFVDG